MLGLIVDLTCWTRNKPCIKIVPLYCLSQTRDSPASKRKLCLQGLTCITPRWQHSWGYICTTISSLQLKNNKDFLPSSTFACQQQPITKLSLGFILMSSHKIKRNTLRTQLQSQERGILKMEWLSLISSLIPNPWPHKHQQIFDSNVISVVHHDKIKTTKTCEKKKKTQHNSQLIFSLPCLETKSELAKTEGTTQYFPYLIYFKRNLEIFQWKWLFGTSKSHIKTRLDASFKMSPYFIVKDKITLNNTLKNKEK